MVSAELPWKGIKALFGCVGAMTAFSNHSKIKEEALQIPRFYALSPTQEQCGIMVVVAAIGALFGVLHCIGWNYIFPSWRVSSVVIMGVPGVMVLTTAALYPIKTDDNNYPTGDLDILFAVLASLSFSIGILGVLPYILLRASSF